MPKDQLVTFTDGSKHLTCGTCKHCKTCGECEHPTSDGEAQYNAYHLATYFVTGFIVGLATLAIWIFH